MTEIWLTLFGVIACAGLTVLGFQKRFARRDDRLIAPIIPWSAVAITSVMTGFILLVHLVNLFGFETGRN